LIDEASGFLINLAITDAGREAFDPGFFADLYREGTCRRCD